MTRRLLARQLPKDHSFPDNRWGAPIWARQATGCFKCERARSFRRRAVLVGSKTYLAPPARLEPATRCLEGVRAFSERNQGDSYLVGDSPTTVG